MSSVTATLYYKDERSDKVYQATVAQQAGGFVVTFAFGRRGGPLTPGSKTPSPVTKEAAEKIFVKLLAEKKAKGYSEGEAAEPMVPVVHGYAHQGAYMLNSAEHVLTAIPVAHEFSPPMLLNEVTAEQAAELALSDEWMAQPKHDGIRLQIHRKGQSVCAFSRTGIMRTALPARIMDAVLAHGGQMSEFVIDGELVGDTFHAFEMLTFGHAVTQGENAGTFVRRDCRGQPAALRLGLLGGQHEWLAGVRIVETATSEGAKLALIARIHAEKGEGVVFKRVSAPYKSGRPNSGGDYLKHKFVTTGSFLVTGLHRQGKRSVELGLADGTRVGSCTIPPNKAIPAVGAVIEVRYLYFVGSLVQAVFLAVREDVPVSDCTARQLKHRQEAE
jgi:bifunctional non-homologous end joining protein LigD